MREGRRKEGKEGGRDVVREGSRERKDVVREGGRGRGGRNSKIPNMQTDRLLTKTPSLHTSSAPSSSPLLLPPPHSLALFSTGAGKPPCFPPGWAPGGRAGSPHRASSAAAREGMVLPCRWCRCGGLPAETSHESN